jgi:aminopeptidase YwaD
MKHLCWLFIFFFQLAHAQKLRKVDKAILAGLQTHIAYLADDKLEGRRAGSNGEKMAYEYISQEFAKAGMQPKGDNGFLQEFEINDGKAIHPATHLIINGNDFKIEKDFFPFACSPNGSIEATAALAMQESGSPWFYDIKEMIEGNKNNPHFDLTDAIKIKAAAAKKMGATAFIIYNSLPSDDGLKFETKDKSAATAIPVLYISNAAKGKYLNDETETLDIKIKVQIEDKKRYGHNVIGFINNDAANTIIIGAHYDHLGYGEDKNSLFTGSTMEIHNGADDNASGTAAVIELGKMLKASKLKNNNYLIIAFSGEELGLFGSKYFIEHPTIEITTANYMLNMDMVGRLRDSLHLLFVSGYGTSPVWGELIPQQHKFFVMKLDSSGTGPSDHTSFYRKDIPVLFFYTGLHNDYHKPSDDADKINYTGELQVLKYIYSIIEATDKKGKLSFTKTRETTMGGKTSFKVTLGIMPDYTFDGRGVRLDGISEGKQAQKAGMKAGDVITQLGDIMVTDIQTYMGALNKFNKGDAARVKVRRGNEEIVIDVIF